MKNIFLIAVYLSMTAGLMANNGVNNPNTSYDNCRKQITEKQPFDSIGEQVRQDLLEGIWTETLEVISTEQRMERVFRFKEIGTVEVVTIFEDGYTEQELQVWRVTQNGGMVLLELTDMSSDDTRVFQVTQTCEGITLKDELMLKEFIWKYQDAGIQAQLKSDKGTMDDISIK